MRTRQELIERMKDYKGAEYVYTDHGYIAWQVSTGENVEIIFIEVKEKRKGYATQLMKEFARTVKPYNSVFVFRLASNESAGYFYRSVGFNEIPVKGLYKDQDAVLGVVKHDILWESLSTK